MPPRKSNVSQVTATDPEGTPSKERDGINIEVPNPYSPFVVTLPYRNPPGTPQTDAPDYDSDTTALQDLSLPRTMVQRLAKGVLPPNTILHKDAILAMSKGATVFINYLAQAYVYHSPPSLLSTDNKKFRFDQARSGNRFEIHAEQTHQPQTQTNVPSPPKPSSKPSSIWNSNPSSRASRQS